jgi:hypothetical protein
MIPFKAPQYEEAAFNCPHCGAYANQEWFDVIRGIKGSVRGSVNDIDLAYCAHCHNYSLWHLERMIYPSVGTAPLQNPDLPDDIKADYEEARCIVVLSPRGSAALLRLAIQRLCKYLGEKGENLNSDIANLVKKGLPLKVQKALDIVRVIGNNAVHPGQIDLKDDSQTAEKLFGLVNLIAQVMITQPKHVDDLYESLPDNQKEAINKRNSCP